MWRRCALLSLLSTRLIFKVLKLFWSVCKKGGLTNLTSIKWAIFLHSLNALHGIFFWKLQWMEIPWNVYSKITSLKMQRSNRSNIAYARSRDSLICVRNYSKIVSIISYPTAVFNKSTFLLSPFMIFSLTFLLAGSLSVTGWKATDATEQQLTTHNLRCNMGIVCGMERDFSWSYEGFGHLM